MTPLDLWPLSIPSAFILAGVAVSLLPFFRRKINRKRNTPITHIQPILFR